MLSFPISYTWFLTSPSNLSVDIDSNNILFKVQTCNVVLWGFNLIVCSYQPVSRIDSNLRPTGLVTERIGAVLILYFNVLHVITGFLSPSPL